MSRYLPCLIALFSLTAIAQQHAAHVHGTAKLDVAIDGNTVTLLLDSPMDSLAGFEHRASSAKDQATLNTLQAALQDAGTLFVFSQDANCTVQSATVASPLFTETGDDHAHETHDQHGHDHGDATHSDLDGEFVFQCASPDKLEALTVNLFDIAANLHDLDVSLAGPRGQKAVDLSAAARTLRF